MTDAASETKRDSDPQTSMTMSLGQHASAVQATLAEAERADVIERIWKKDASLWKQEESHRKIIDNSLGWLIVPSEMIEAAEEVKQFAESIRDAGVQQVMICGMGGSSLCPEVLRQTFGRQKHFPEL